jgi:hypothetical protein
MGEPACIHCQGTGMISSRVRRGMVIKPCLRPCQKCTNTQTRGGQRHESDHQQGGAEGTNPRR